MNGLLAEAFKKNLNSFCGAAADAPFNQTNSRIALFELPLGAPALMNSEINNLLNSIFRKSYKLFVLLHVLLNSFTIRSSIEGNAFTF